MIRLGLNGENVQEAPSNNSGCWVDQSKQVIMEELANLSGMLKYRQLSMYSQKIYLVHSAEALFLLQDAFLILESFNEKKANFKQALIFLFLDSKGRDQTVISRTIKISFFCIIKFPLMNSKPKLIIVQRVCGRRVGDKRYGRCGWCGKNRLRKTTLVQYFISVQVLVVGSDLIISRSLELFFSAAFLRFEGYESNSDFVVRNTHCVAFIG
ncbi:hypothetical protein BpHYR1_033430 [Brachionus plicatilis]|uniref:Uncharacterized protein n=1 Tax=Brachionus plicatilis TaxID=10195 RepID=A0A3M7QG37_BRAPC|nr:hypothetical protein BpHYR1_033430 [Brachionus plicatilis]